MTTSIDAPRGFTLVEVLVALTIFTIGILAVATMMTSSIRYNGAARLSSEAVFLAERKVEELLAGTFDAAVVGTKSKPEGSHTVSWTVADQVTHKTIAVTVTWKDSTGNKSYSLNSIKGNF